MRDAAAAQVPGEVSIGLKWPNDVMAAGKKLAGVLVESQLTGDRVAAVVAGIGLNVAMRELPDDIAAVATSLALLGAHGVEQEALLCDVLRQIERRLGEYVASGLEPLLDAIRDHDVLYGTRVRVDGEEGTARGIDASGALLLEVAGSVRAVVAGTVLGV